MDLAERLLGPQFEAALEEIEDDCISNPHGAYGYIDDLNDTIRELRSRLAAAKADLAAAREEIARPKEDSERINVVEEREWLLIPTRKHLSDGSGYEIWWSVQDRRTRRQITHPYGNPRAAIDAARAGGTR